MSSAASDNSAVAADCSTQTALKVTTSDNGIHQSSGLEDAGTLAATPETNEAAPNASATEDVKDSEDGQHEPISLTLDSVTNTVMMEDVAAAAAAATVKDERAFPEAEQDATEEENGAALACMQEAASIVMEAAKKRKIDTTEADDRPSKRAAPQRVPWEERMQQLKDYKEKHGNLLIPIRYKLNPSLGKFVHNTREQYKLYHKRTPDGYKKKCSLTASRIEQLEKIGFVWSTDRTKRQNDDWQARFQQLKEYKQKHGDCLVPHGYTEDPSFAEWIHRQRTTYAAMLRDEKPNAMVQARMDQLIELGFNFTVHADKWMDHWQQLKRYQEEHGNCQVPTHYAENPKLGRWVHTQRHQRRLQLKGKKSCMTDERVELLDRLGFSWEVRPSLERPRASWQQRYEELRDFYNVEQHFRVPPDRMPQLYSWCQEQRQRLKMLAKNGGKDISKRMGPDRVAALIAIGFAEDTPLYGDDNALSGLPGVRVAEDAVGLLPVPDEAHGFSETAIEEHVVGVDSAPPTSLGNAGIHVSEHSVLETV